ncbi:hypothetical protein AXA44_46950 [Rhodococcus sp. SC4]|nr:hypothetical protein AXA44_46950 [Rhodococcus sp. SC4]KXX62898.1 hypothetical protein AZG88_27020 [Rhodococcus sp. LB1]PBC56143.1 hypothetical protein CJ177_10600 [Rhodococcus sp. ACPA1]
MVEYLRFAESEGSEHAADHGGKDWAIPVNEMHRPTVTRDIVRTRNVGIVAPFRSAIPQWD